jgi:type IV secretory pathway TrbD component
MIDETTKDVIEAGAAWVATKAMFSGAFAAVVGAVTSSQFVGVAGVSIGFVGLLINWYFKARTDAREQREHEARMRRQATKPGEL